MKNWFIVVISVVAVILLILFLTKKAETVYIDRWHYDTTYIVNNYQPDSITKQPTINHIDTIAQDLPEIDTIYKDCKFVVNLFDKNIISPVEMLAQDIQRWYIITKPFEAIDTIITKKNDTVMTRFDLTVQSPGNFNHFINYSPDSTLTITKTVTAKKEWYESQLLSGAGGAILTILIMLAVK